MKTSLNHKRILIVDEAGFSRICSAILEKEGYGTNAVTDVRQLDTQINYDEIGLVITSYPYGADLFQKLISANIPTIILSDHMNRELISTLEKFDQTRSHCMIKPLDYDKFRTLVSQTMETC